MDDFQDYNYGTMETYQTESPRRLSGSNEVIHLGSNNHTVAFEIYNVLMDFLGEASQSLRTLSCHS